MSARRSTSLRDDNGVMLVELLVVIILMSVIGGIVTTSLVAAMRHTTSGQERAIALAELQRGAERTSRELRSGTPLAVSEYAASVDVFRSGRRERVTYTLTSSGVLQEDRRTWNSATADPATTAPDATTTRPVLSRLLYTAAFACRDRNGSVMPGCTPLQNVDRIDMSLRRTLPTQPALRLDSSIELRNTNLGTE